MDNKEILAFNSDVIRCIDCVYSGASGTICRYSVGRSTHPDDFCSNGEAYDSEKQNYV